MIRLSSETDATYAPYSNICPIAGHDSVTVGDTGVNQWDEEWENGLIDNTTGMDTPSAINIRSTNYIPVVGGKSYYFHVGSEVNIRIFFYDSTKTPITLGTGNIYHDCNNEAYTMPQNAAYIRFRTYNSYGDTYNNDISINYPSTDTSYHAYYGQSKTVTLPHTVYGAGVGVTSGSGKEKYGIVDLGTFTWSVGTDSRGQYFYTAFDQYKTLTTPTLPNAKCSIYPFAPSSNVQDKNIAFAQGVPKRIYIRDTSYATAADFKTAMSGVQLCYELNAPTDLSTTPTDLTLYSGDNVISSDGDMESPTTRAS